MTPIAIAHLDGAPTGLQFHPNGQFVLVVLQGAVEVRIAASGEKVWGTSVRAGVEGACFAEDGRSVLLASEGYLWRVQAGEKERLEATALTLFCRSPDGRVGVLQTGNLRLAVIELATLHVREPFNAANFTPVGGAVSNDGARVLFASSLPHLAGNSTMPPRIGWSKQAIGPFALHPDGSRLVHGDIGDTGLLRVLSWDKQMPLAWSPPRTELVFDVGYSTDGALLHVCGQDGVRLFAADGTSAGTLSHTGFGNAESGVTHGAFSPNSGLFASVTLGRDFFVWDLGR